MSGSKNHNPLALPDAERSKAEYARALHLFEISKQRKFVLDRLPRAFGLLAAFERLSSRLYLARAKLPLGSPQRERLEDYLATASHHMLRLSTAHPDKGEESFTYRYRKVWRENFPLFLFSAVAFIGSLLIGWYVTFRDPSNVSAFVGRETMENVISKHRWFDDVQGGPIAIGIAIGLNNIRVAINTFLGGVFFGLGGLFFLIYNGLNFGALMAFCYRYGFHEQLGTFVIAHGFLELSIIVAAAFAGFIFGRVFFMRPYRLFGFRWRKASRDSVTVLMGILPWLVLAAIIEVGVSPWPTFSVPVRIGIGAVAGLLFWTWTFSPLKSRASS